MSPHMLHLRHQYCWECGSEATVCLLGIRERSDRVSTRNSGPRSIIIVIVVVVIIRVIQLGPTWGLPAPTPGQLEADCGLLSRPRVFFRLHRSGENHPKIVPRSSPDVAKILPMILRRSSWDDLRKSIGSIFARSWADLVMVLG